MIFRSLFVVLSVLTLTGTALAQEANVGFGGAGYDSSLPVEVTADQLDVSQTDGQATFTGNVVVGQGEMRMTGSKVVVEYGDDASGKSEIRKLHATGGVTLVSGSEAAEANEAIYTIESGVVVMTGDVFLTQGENAMAGEKLTVNLDSGTGLMEGRVRVVFNPDEQPGQSQ